MDRYPPSRDLGDNPLADLKFSLRYEPLDFRVLSTALTRLQPDTLGNWIASEPTGALSRRAWFLFETLTGQRLALPDAGAAPYAPALDPEYHVTGRGFRSQRHKVLDNLPGTRDLCPLVRRTAKLDTLLSADLRGAIAAIVRASDPDLLARAVSYLYTKETRSSFAIEGEAVTPDRARRFVAALQDAWSFDPTREAEFVRLQNLIVDGRYAASGWRDFQNFVGETGADYREIVHCIFPRPRDVPSLMRGLGDLIPRVASMGLHPVVAAAMASFAFVFVHPFEDGNGRIHRYLIHAILAGEGLTPAGMVLPVSATMVRNQHAYDVALGSFSSDTMPFVDWRWDKGDGGEIVVVNDTAPLYRFFDATSLVEYLCDCVVEAIYTDLKQELDFLDLFSRALPAVKDVVDMPERRAVLLIKLLLQNGGRLSRAKHEKEFPELSDDEVSAMELAIAGLQTAS